MHLPKLHQLFSSPWPGLAWSGIEPSRQVATSWAVERFEFDACLQSTKIQRKRV